MPTTMIQQTLAVPAGSVRLQADLTLPSNRRGLVVFADGNGNSRHHPRTRRVAERLFEHDVGTLLLDLSVHDEEEPGGVTTELRSDVPLLSERLGEATDWITEHPPTDDLPVGYLGVGTGGAAALLAAAVRPRRVGAVVSCGGRPDMVGSALSHLRAPTLLIADAGDAPALETNRKALDEISASSQLHGVPGAGHLLEESTADADIIEVVGSWVGRHLGSMSASPATPTPRSS